jgi:hypothetical protein
VVATLQRLPDAVEEDQTDSYGEHRCDQPGDGDTPIRRDPPARAAQPDYRECGSDQAKQRTGSKEENQPDDSEDQ